MSKKKMKEHQGECKFQFKVTGCMKDAALKTRKEFYKKQIELALTNANIQSYDVDVFFDF